MASERERAARWVLALVMVLATSIAAAAFVAEPAAVLVQFQGQVQVQRSGQSAAQAASVGLQLMAGDRVLVPSGGKAVLLHKSGRLETATANVQVTEAQRAETGTLFDRTVKTLTEVATTDARNDPNRQGMIRPLPGAAVPIAPRNEIVVLDVRPHFTWFRVPEASAYMLQVRRVDGPCAGDGENRPALCAPVRWDVGGDTTWTMSATLAPLLPGATYEWTVGGSGAGRPALPQKFRVAGPAEYAALAASLRAIADAGLDPAADGLFMAALAYRDAGLIYEASRALDALARSGAGTGSAFHNLRGEIYDALGDVPGAEREFKKAEATAN